MLRDNTESFAPDFSKVLKAFQVEKTDDNGFQLLKFERITPDVFIWLLRSSSTYAMTISDIKSDLPAKEFIAKWLGDYDSAKLTTLFTADGSIYFEDDFDKINLFQLPDDYDHDDRTGYFN